MSFNRQNGSDPSMDNPKINPDVQPSREEVLKQIEDTVSDIKHKTVLAIATAALKGTKTGLDTASNAACIGAYANMNEAIEAFEDLLDDYPSIFRVDAWKAAGISLEYIFNPTETGRVRLGMRFRWYGVGHNADPNTMHEFIVNIKEGEVKDPAKIADINSIHSFLHAFHAWQKQNPLPTDASEDGRHMESFDKPLLGPDPKDDDINRAIAEALGL